MKHTTRLLLAVIDLALGNIISVSGKVHGKPTPAVQVNSASGTTIGSGYCEYWMTNEDSGNCILAADVGSDGQVNLREAYATGGMGLHGINGGNTGPDGLFGQGPVAVSNVTNMLVAVNRFSFISINPSDPSNLSLRKVVASGPRRSRSTMNGGEVNGISCFPVHQTSGLTPLADTARYLGINPHLLLDPRTPSARSSFPLTLQSFSWLTLDILGTMTSVLMDLSRKTFQLSPSGVLPFSITSVLGQEAYAYVVADPALGFEVFDLTGVNHSSAAAISGQGATWCDLLQGRIFEIALIDSLIRSYPNQSDAGFLSLRNPVYAIGFHMAKPGLNKLIQLSKCRKHVRT
ncbi:hypothetical protein F5879DRAFT_925827 [Lentinula edodes]|nr:hypothetical protein F5879DRAFT_925827 [Lentinula edodes]